MGLFGSSAPPAPKTSSDGAPIAPDRSQRAKCWEARDAFFQCLDKNNIVDSLAEKGKADKACGKEDKQFGQDCASSWVSHGSLMIISWVMGIGIRGQGIIEHLTNM